MSAHFLYLTNDKLVAIVKRGDTTLAHEKFAVADIERPTFAEHLTKYKEMPLQLYIDLIEEDFRLDTIPHLRGSDQAAVLERRLGQLYRASNYRHAILQGREEEGRRDDRVFLHAITNPDLLKSVINVLEAVQIPLEGIYSSPVLSHQLLRDLEIVFSHTLLVSIVPDFGLRQTYFQGKQIKFSRITPISYDEGQSVGALIAAETSRTWQYLDSLRFFSADDSLEVCILVHERDRTMIADAIRSYPLLRYRFLEIGEVAAKLKLKPAPDTSHAEEVWIHLYGKSRQENHFASREQMRFARYRRARIALFSVTAVILAAGIIATSYIFFLATQITKSVDASSLEERRLQAEYQSIANSITQQKVATEAVRDSSIFFNSQLRPSPATPGTLIRDLALVMNDFNRVKISRLTWAVSNDAAFTPAYLTSPATGALNISSTGGTSSGPPASGGPGVVATLAAAAGLSSSNSVSAPNLNDPNQPLAGNKYHSVVIEAALTDYAGDLRAALNEVEAFRRALQKIPNAKATLLVLPVDISAAATLKVEAEVPPMQGEARFVIKLTQRVEGT